VTSCDDACSSAFECSLTKRLTIFAGGLFCTPAAAGSYVRTALDDTSQGIFVKSTLTFRDRVDVVSPGLRIFANLAVEYSERSRMLEQEVPRLVVDSMRHFNEDPSVSGALARCSPTVLTITCRRLWKTVGFEIADSSKLLALKPLARNSLTQVQLEALVALCVLANDKGCRAAMVEAGAIATTLLAVQRYVSSLVHARSTSTLPFAICHLPFAICHLPFAVCRLSFATRVIMCGHVSLSFFLSFAFYLFLDCSRLAWTTFFCA
jgi:hypothetical protein